MILWHPIRALSHLLTIFILLLLVFPSSGRSGRDINLEGKTIALRIQETSSDHIDRKSYEFVVHLYGDSILKGYAFRQFGHPSPLNSIQGILQFLDAKKERSAKKAILFRFANSQDPNKMWKEVSSGIIREGDVVIFQNAGPHFNNIEAYRMWIKLIKFACSNDSAHRKVIKTNLILTTTPDYEPPPKFYNSKYDSPIEGSALSINDVVRQEAEADHVGLLDWNLLMDEAVAAMSKYGASPILSDGVHPNIFGNFLLAASLLEYLGISVKGYASVYEEFLEYRNQYVDYFHFKKELSKEQIYKILSELIKIARSHPKSNFISPQIKE